MNLIGQNISNSSLLSEISGKNEDCLCEEAYELGVLVSKMKDLMVERNYLKTFKFFFFWLKIMVKCFKCLKYFEC